MQNPEVWAEARQHLEANYWLLKCNVKTYSYNELLDKEHRTDTWGDKGFNGPKRDTRAKIWDTVAEGDMALFYEFGGGRLAVVGVVDIVEVIAPDLEKYKRPIFRIKAASEQEFPNPVSLGQKKQVTKSLGLPPKNERMSIYGITPEEFQEILRMGMGEQQP